MGAEASRDGSTDQPAESRRLGPIKRLILRLRLYRLAAWLYEPYRLVARPRTQGALVA